jgi:hemerythrin
MRFITWTKSYAVNIEEIDAQHQWLTDIINTLYDDLSEGKGKRLLEIVLESLIQYTRLHFETEENLMIKYKYPRYEEHKAHHQMLSEKVLEWNSALADGKASLTQDMLEYLKAWLENHEVTVDQPLGVYLNARGMK